MIYDYLCNSKQITLFPLFSKITCNKLYIILGKYIMNPTQWTKLKENNNVNLILSYLKSAISYT